MKTIAIFGVTGTVGVYTAIELKSHGYNVIGIARRNDNNFFKKYGIEYLSIDITKKEDLKKLDAYNIDEVIHYAGAMPARIGNYNPYIYINSVIIGTLNILEFMRQRGASKIIFSQSISDVLYLFGTTVPIKAESEMKFPKKGDHAVYSIAKNTAVNLIEHYFSEYGIKPFILRLPTIYVYHPNPFYYVDGEKRWMGYRYLINQATKGEPIEIWGNPNTRKELVYVKDFTQLVRKCVESNLDGGIYNAATGIGVRFEDQVRSIIDIFSEANKKSPVIYRPEKPSSPQFVLDISNAKKDLAYEPKYNLEAYLVDFKHEMKSEPFGELWGYSKDYLK